MKTTLILALLALTVTSVFSFEAAFYNGLNSKLGLSSNNLQLALTCQNSIAQNVNNAIGTILTTNVNNVDPQVLLVKAFSLYQKLQQDVQTYCGAYLSNIAQWAIKANPRTYDFEALVRNNSQQYAPYILQQLNTFFTALGQGDDYAAGQAFGYILQILFGVVKPQILPIPQIDPRKTVPLNYTNFVRDFISNYFNGIGLTDKTAINSHIQCLNSLHDDLPAIGWSLDQVARLNTTEAQLNATKGVFSQLIDVVVPCVTAAKTGFAFSAPYVQFFKDAPVLFILRVISNIAGNAPQLNQLEAQKIVSVAQGDYAGAGKTQAVIYNTLAKGLRGNN